MDWRALWGTSRRSLRIRADADHLKTTGIELSLLPDLRSTIDPGERRNEANTASVDPPGKVTLCLKLESSWNDLQRLEGMRLIVNESFRSRRTCSGQQPNTAEWSRTLRMYRLLRVQWRAGVPSDERR
jgi:hypothetical protein